MNLKVLFLLIVFIPGSLALAVPAFPYERKMVGLVERVIINPGNLIIHAKLDTGAKNSSLHATNITKFTRNGEDWIRFDVMNNSGAKVTLERKVERSVRIKRMKGEPRERLAIRLGICLGSMYKEVEVNLVDRKKFEYRMLIGRSFMVGDITVDPSISYTIQPNCMEISNK